MSIGTPASNTRVYVLGRKRTPVPIGGGGELYIGGDGLAHGYLNNPELTAEKFVPNPFSEGAQERLYRTGDLARWRADRQIEFLGRLDKQVKIRGFRIEPGEVEAVLKEHPAVASAVVVAREDIPGDRRLVAYVVARNRNEEVSAALRNFLASQMPDYLVPSAFAWIQPLPLITPRQVVSLSPPPPRLH